MFRSNFQVCPIDYGTDAFYANRSQMILTRFEELWKSNLTTEVEQVRVSNSPYCTSCAA
eukprot:m.338575 g.338575  ORF g.338575 m.338575 type:complete len:59 (-) comp16086_c0_seq8:95-271(-)